MKTLVHRNPLFFAFSIPALADGVVTILGQGSQYWNSHRTVIEASPAYYILMNSPWIFILGSIIWFVFWYWLMNRLKEPYNIFLMFFFIAGHSWGSSSWIIKMLKETGVYTLGNQPSIFFAWSVLVLYFIVIAGVATYCLNEYLRFRK